MGLRDAVRSQIHLQTHTLKFLSIYGVHAAPPTLHLHGCVCNAIIHEIPKSKTMASDITLYRLKPGHSLPSCSLGCLYLEVCCQCIAVFVFTSHVCEEVHLLQGYLAIALAQQRRREEERSSQTPSLTQSYRTVDCTWETCSPSGRLPCLDWKGKLVCRPESCTRDDYDGMEEAEYIIQRMHQMGILPAMHLDDALDDEHRAVCEGFVCLLKQIVVPAIQSSLWLEKRCYHAFTQDMFGKGLSFPLNRILPRVQQFHMKRSSSHRLKHHHEDEEYSTSDSNVYTAASRALERIGKYVASMKPLEQREMQFAFYPSPSSCDALLFSCLSMIRCFPVHSALRQASKPLDRYADALARNVVGTSITMGAIADRTWANIRPILPPSSHAQHSHEEQETPASIGTKGTYWLIGVGTLFAAYILLGGQYFEIQELMEDEDDH